MLGISERLFPSEQADEPQAAPTSAGLKRSGLVPGSWPWGRARGLPPRLRPGVAPRKNAVCEICYPACPALAAASISLTVPGVSSDELREEWGAGGGPAGLRHVVAQRSPHPSGAVGSLAHKRGTRSVWGVEQIPPKSRRLLSTRLC